MKTKEKPRGVPFQKGEDPRRHLAGRKSKAALSFKADMRRLIEERTDAEQIYNVLLRKAKAGVQWAVQELLDRGLGKPMQSVETKDLSGTTYRIVYAHETDPSYHGDVHLAKRQGPSALAREQFEAAEARGLLGPGPDAEAADDPAHEVTDEELLKACEEA